jgi:Protein of unknown function (DUF4058)/Protein of unknown function (DUF2934)
MPSPFPGMDPYLEDPALWPAFHHQLLACFYQILRPGLVDRYLERVTERRYDVADKGEQAEVFIEIRSRSDDKLVTLLEVVSPANKTTAAGRQAYLDTRREAIGKHAGVVEIDLVLQGKPTLTYSREGLPHFDHAVSVTRATAPDRYEIYTATLQKRLPKFKVPLAPDDRDTLLDLQSCFTRAYDLGGFGTRINYDNDPPVKLKDEDDRWCVQLLRSHGLRTKPEPTDDEIAVAAYYLWQQEGCPEGKEAEHWNRAKEQLRGRDTSHSNPPPHDLTPRGR